MRVSSAKAGARRYMIGRAALIFLQKAIEPRRNIDQLDRRFDDLAEAGTGEYLAWSVPSGAVQRALVLGTSM
jgi:hypothetical protein